jgi:aminoglycoside phosphotransferase (APT) family kinase protein
VTTLDPDELRNRLGELLDGRRLAEIDQRPCPYRTSYELDELDVRLDDGTSLALVLKRLGRSALDPAARRAKPAFLHDPLREIEVYRSLLEPAGLGTPRFHGAVVEPSDDRYWLLIENVAGEVLWQVGELDVWREAARWLAVLHDRFRDRVPESARTHLLRYDAGFYASWMQRALEFADADRRSELEAIAKRYDEVVERLAALRATFIHGEFYASNVLIQRGDGRVRIAPIDWENAALGPGVVDLAALTTGGWNDAERAEIARGYAEQSSALGEDLDPRELREALDLARLHLAIQWLGWDPGWSPPAEHRQDWLGEAVSIARRTGLVDANPN